MKKEETYYDLLKIKRNASVHDVVDAYSAAKLAFSKDSIATYSLMENEEVGEILSELETAYSTLSNIEKRREYDRWLDAGGDSREPFKPSTSRREAPLKAVSNPVADVTPAAPTTPPASPEATPSASTDPTSELNAPITSSFLREERERRGLTLDDIARITKIPVKFIASLERYDHRSLPARVYVQGFVKNLAALYKLDVKTAVSVYLDHLDNATQKTSKSA